MATTYTYTQAGTRVPGHKGPSTVAVGKIVRFANVAAGVGVVTGDVIQVIAVPANTLVLGVHVEVRAGQDPDELCTGLTDLNVGDGSDIDGYHNGIDASAALDVYSGAGNLLLVEAAPNTIFGYTNGKYYAAADTIDLAFTQTITAGVLKVVALMIPFTDRSFSDNMTAQ